MQFNKNIKIIKPVEPKPISKTRTQKEGIDKFKPEILPVKTAWEILPPRSRNVNRGR